VLLLLSSSAPPAFHYTASRLSSYCRPTLLALRLLASCLLFKVRDAVERRRFRFIERYFAWRTLSAEDAHGLYVVAPQASQIHIAVYAGDDMKERHAQRE